MTRRNLTTTEREPFHPSGVAALTMDTPTPTPDPDLTPTPTPTPGPEGGFSHLPVMLDEILAILEPVPAGILLDATLGGGGHASALLEALAPIHISEPTRPLYTSYAVFRLKQKTT